MTVKKQKGTVSSIDVARLAGVSQSTVSRAFTSGASISEEKRRKIYEAAVQLKYRPNVIARSLAQSSTKIIGILMTRFASPFYAGVLGDFTRRIQENGYSTLLLNVDGDKDLHEVFFTALQYQVDGLIITSTYLSPQMVESCIRSTTPIVLFNRYSENNEVNAVYCDGFQGGRMVAEHLLPDHRRFACIRGEARSSTSRDRSSGYMKRLQEEGVDGCICVDADLTYDSGFAAARHLLDRDQRPDAIFCTSDLMAFGAMDAARRVFGLRIPEDLSIVGFDNIPMASWGGYDLTTAAQPGEKMVEATVDLLLRSIQNQSPGTVTLKMITELVVRSSTRHR